MSSKCGSGSPSGETPATLAIDGSIATITLNRAHAFNAIDPAISKCLETLAQRAEVEEQVSVVIVEGAGSAFCAGGDLQTITGNADSLEMVLGDMISHYHAFIAALRRMPKIVITSVNGSAAGAGLSLAFMGDLCIAADDARFIPAYGQLGVSPDGGGTVGLVGAAGPQLALRIFLAEDNVSAAQAHAWGLVAKVVPAASLKAETRALAERIARNSPAAIAATKALVYNSGSRTIEAQLDAEKRSLLACTGTRPFRANVNRIVEARLNR
jgi:enoyl-CoA hydratase/carnithine racemase